MPIIQAGQCLLGQCCIVGYAIPVIQAGHFLLGQCCILGNARYSCWPVLTWAVLYCRVCHTCYSSWSFFTWAVLYCRECPLFMLANAYLGSAVLYVMSVIHAGQCLLGQCCIICNVRYSSWSLHTWTVLYCRECPLFKLINAYLGSAVLYGMPVIQTGNC